MNENSKTFAFVAAGVAALAVGWFASRPAATGLGPADEIGKQFFPDFTDPQKVATAEIVDFDATSDTKHDLKAARVDGDWQLNPDKQGYPEVNAERLAEVVNAVGDLKKLSVVSDDRSKHRDFGVVDPGSEAELKEGTEGVGKRVDLLDDGRRALVRLIVGKAADEKNAQLRYVREPDRDRVYSTEIEADKLSSRFEDWVKPDLLGASNGELRFVSVNDYGIDLSQEKQAPVVQGGVMFLPPATLEQVYRTKAVLAKKPPTKPDATADVWQIDDFQTYDKDKKAFVERKLEPDEELESFKLSDLGRNLGTIKVVDVVRKPKVLAEDLAGDVNFLTNAASPVRKDRDSITQLIAYGFRPTQSRTGDEARLICFEGELTVGFADGVEYLLRFGDITGKGRAGEGEKKEDAKPDEAKADEKPADGAAEGSNTAPNRYLMVTARFNESLIPKPKLTELPPETPAAAAPTGDKKPAEDKPDEPKPTAEKKTEEKKEPTQVEANDGAGGCDDQDAAKDEADKKDEKKTEPAKPAADVKPAAETKPAADSKPAAETKPAEEAKPALTPEERKRIETENKTKQEKYEADLKAGRDKAEELNGKFAQWFYVISDSTYQNLNVDPTTLIRKAAAADAAAKPAVPAVPGLPNLDLLPQKP